MYKRLLAIWRRGRWSRVSFICLVVSALFAVAAGVVLVAYHTGYIETQTYKALMRPYLVRGFAFLVASFFTWKMSKNASEM